MDKTKIQKYLKDRGHDEEKVDSKDWKDDKAAKKSICELNGVTEDEYKRAGGTL